MARRSRDPLARAEPSRSAEEAAQEWLGVLAADLERLGEGLEAIAASVPASPREDEMLEEGGEWDVATELRTVIEGIVACPLKRMIESLRAAAVYRPSGA